MPTRYYDGGTQRYLVTEAEAQIARRVSEDYNVEDVYEIKTSFNTYEFQIVNTYDQSQSRFRPIKKFTRVKFQLDKPVEDVKALLADFPEAVALCSQECTMFRESGIFQGLIVQPTKPSPEELKDAAFMAHGWKDDEKPRDSRLPKQDWETWEWVKGFKFQFDMSGKRVESGTFQLMVKGKGEAAEPLTRIGVWRSSEK